MVSQPCRSAEQTLRLRTVRRAETPAEREAIYRLRYAVYVEELNKSVANADHGRRWLRDPEDDQDVALLYTGTADEVTGSLRIALWPPGAAPPELSKRFSLQFFPDIERQTIAEVSRFVVTSQLRRQLIFPALAGAAYRYLAEHAAYMIFSYCAPGLLDLYQRLGYRTYPCQLIDSFDGLRVPVVNLSPDVRYYREVRSPLLPLVREHFEQGPPQGFDLRRYARLVEETGDIETDVATIWAELQANPAAADSISIFDGVPDADVRSVLAHGHTLRLPAGQTVTRARLVEQEVFLILDGTFEELAPDGRQLAMLTQGDLFGELSLFLPGGHRPTSIRSVTSGKLLVLNRRFLAALAANDPPVAVRVLHNLGRVMATRLSTMIEAPSAERSSVATVASTTRGSTGVVAL
jgi:CRP-like cAMP-binding protein